MKITYTLWLGSRIVGSGLVAYRVEDINKMIEELSKLDKHIKPHATILKVEHRILENGDN